MMPEDYEALLKHPYPEPPDDFARRVMARIEELPLPEFSTPPSRARERIQWLALAGAALVAALQLAAFMFGIWTATIAN